MARRPRSLRVELLATLTVVLMMAAVSLSLSTELLGQRRHEQEHRTRLEEHTRGLAAIVGPRLEPGALAAVRDGSIEPVLRPSVGSLGIEAIEIHRLELDRGRGSVLVSVGLAPSLDPPRTADGADGTVATIGDDTLVVDRALPVFGPERGHLALVLRVIARPTSWTRHADWSTTFVLAGGVGLVLLVLGGVLLEVQVLGPLRAVRRAADEVADGNLDAVVPAEGPAEFFALADAFNRMTASLQRQIEHNAAQRESLVRAEQLASVGRISAGVAHEIGNPLAAILGYVALLLDPRTEPALSDEQRALLERCRDQLERIQATVGQLLDYSRPARGAVTSLSAHGTVERLLSLLRHDPRCSEVTLELVGDRSATVVADPAQLDGALQNLLINACRASSASASASASASGTEPPAEDRAAPLVRVSIEPTADDQVAIEIQDTGPGIDEALRPRLFEPFVTTARAGEGTGLGLAISRGLVEGMGGRLECLDAGARPPLRSEGSPGAVFRITLPRADAAAEADGADDTPHTDRS